MYDLVDPHCQLCGNTNPEDVMFRSYSGCCNELVVIDHDDCDHENWEDD